jgi:hypothetical protein
MRTLAKFRLIQTPCCEQLLCWVNPRLPNHCPECGKFIYADLKHHKPERILETHETAWIIWEEAGEPV